MHDSLDALDIDHDSIYVIKEITPTVYDIIKTDDTISRRFNPVEVIYKEMN